MYVLEQPGEYTSAMIGPFATPDLAVAWVEATAPGWSPRPDTVIVERGGRPPDDLVVTVRHDPFRAGRGFILALLRLHQVVPPPQVERPSLRGGH
jgi:hypothetical protein